MTIRTDVQVNWQLSPRLIIVDAPSVEITIQDLVDTARHLEAEIGNIEDDPIISAAGKESLGGGVTVGITATLQNSQLYFESRDTPLDNTKTVSTGNAAGTVCTSSGSFFQSDGLARGDIIFNGTTGASATVLSIELETQVTHLPLSGGSRADWQIGDNITTYDNTQCSVSGGNAVAVDGDDVSIPVILESFMTQVVRTAASSATTSNQAQLEYSTFSGGVSVNTATGTAGTEYPIGTPGSPSNNLVDTRAIAISRGFDTIYFKNSITIDAGDFDEFKFIGTSETNTVITIDPAASVINCEVVNATVTGTLDGGTSIKNCIVTTLAMFNGIISDCIIDGPITLGGVAEAIFKNCSSGVAGQATPIINMGGDGPDLIVRGWNGGLSLTNKTGATGATSIDLDSGQIIVESSVTAGEITVRGIGKLTNNSTGTTVINAEILDSANLNKTLFIDGRVYIDTTDGIAGTNFPLGTAVAPVDNITDALTIMHANELHGINLRGFITTAADLDGVDIIGGSGSSNIVGLLNGVTTNAAAFEQLIVYGEFNGLSRVRSCILGTTGLGGVTELEGRVVDCIINHTDGIIQKSSGAGTLLDNCSFIAPDDPQITLNANGKGLSLRHCTGNILVTNKTDIEADQLHVDGARLEIAASCTAGTYNVSGSGVLTDNSAGTTVVDDMHSTKTTEVHRIMGLDLSNAMTVTPTARTAGSISQTITGNGETTTTVTRDP